MLHVTRCSFFFLLFVLTSNSCIEFRTQKHLKFADCSVFLITFSSEMTLFVRLRVDGFCSTISYFRLSFIFPGVVGKKSCNVQFRFIIELS
uniref:Secreted protein n=1 Tax=Rhizophora mucronata TaxID=61149 RepID=A0A2P2PPU4_RHIMU